MKNAFEQQIIDSKAYFADLEKALLQLYRTDDEIVARQDYYSKVSQFTRVICLRVNGKWPLKVCLYRSLVECL
jgi:hypothetical protein